VRHKSRNGNPHYRPPILSALMRLKVPARQDCRTRKGGAMILKRMGGAKLTHFTRQELHALLREAKACSERDWLGILVCYSHAMRVSELIALTVSDVCDGHIIVTRGKGSERVTYPLMEDADPLFDDKTALEAFCQHKTQNTL